MFEFLKKKPANPPPPAPKPGPAEAPAPAREALPDLPAAAPPARTGFSPDDLARAFTDVQAEKAARAEAEKAQARIAVRETVGGSFLARSLGGLFSGNPKLDESLLEELETALIGADVGVTASTELLDRLRKRMKAREFADAAALYRALRADLLALLAPIAKPLVIESANKPFVILTVGVNGVGKTTTIGKLARRFQDDGLGLMLAAGDTFRAAAVEQLKIWGERNNVAVIAQGQNADAASVSFDALQAARSRGYDVLIVDTAGRLHTQAGLMASQLNPATYCGRYTVVVDEDIDASNLHDVIWAMGTRSDPQTDITHLNQCQSSRLDPMHGEDTLYNSRVVINACRPYERLATFPPVAQTSPELAAEIRKKFPNVYRY